MEVRPVVLLGSGGHAKVIADILRRQDVPIAGSLSPAGSALPRVPWLGDDSVLQSMNPAEYRIHVAVGSNRLREKLTVMVRSLGFELAEAVSHQAVISPDSRIGAGVAVMPGAVINCDARIGDGTIINTGATVDHDCDIRSFVHIAPGCHLAGNVTVESGAFLGTGTAVIPKINIGKWAVTGAGSVVICDIPEQTTVVGVPARVKLRPERPE